MEWRHATADGKISTGTRVLVRSSAAGDLPFWDRVRGVFTQEIVLRPYAPNEKVEGLLLTQRSWCQVTDVILVDKQEVPPINKAEGRYE